MQAVVVHDESSCHQGGGHLKVCKHMVLAADCIRLIIQLLPEGFLPLHREQPSSCCKLVDSAAVVRAAANN
jgi:hypothetical protein